MLEVKRKTLLPGVTLMAARTEKFKSSLLSVTLLTPLQREKAGSYALIPHVLRRGTAELPDMEALSAALDGLYGGSIEPYVRKKGETHCLGFVGSFLDDAYALDGSAILEPAAALMGDLLLRPYTQDGHFCPDYTAQEKAHQVDRIHAQMNDKRSYAVHQLLRAMCADEGYGVSALGEVEQVEAVTPEGLWEDYQALLASARVAVYYCGSAPLERVEAAISAALQGLPRGAVKELGCEIRDKRATPEPAVVTERLDVTQGKLSLGLRTGGASLFSEDYPALVVFNALYGGTATSRLFLHVREELSLCYYASSMVEKLKGVMVVSSGIEFENYQKALDEILAQLKVCQTGSFADWELEAARQAAISQLNAALDSQGQLEDYWLTQTVAGLTETPEALVRRLAAVTKEQVMAAASGTELDTVYFLKGMEG